MNHPTERLLGSTAARAALVGLAYFAAAELGHALSFQAPNRELLIFWPPSGLLLAALVLHPRGTWPAVLAGAWVACLTSDVLFHDKSMAVSLGYCATNGLETCLGAWLLRRFVAGPVALTRVADVVGLGGLAALLSTMVAATIGAGVATEPVSTSYWSSWNMWWIRDALGILVMAPIVFAWAAPPPVFESGTNRRRITECVALFVGVGVVTEAVYGDWLPSSFAVPIFILPFLLWATLRFGTRSVVTALFVVVVVGIWNTAAGRGPYVALTALPSEQLFRGQGSLAVISASFLLLAAVVAERQRAFAEIKTLRAELEQRVGERTAQLQTSLQEKETLLREIHHRVKNNLSVISSLFYFESRETRDGHTLDVLQEARNRVRSMALVHDRLYRSPNLAALDFREYVGDLLKHVVQTHARSDRVVFRTEIEPIMFDVEVAIPCGLILNELVTNGLKHAFPAGHSGEIAISLHREDGRCVLSVTDTGIGIPADLDVDKTRSLGLRLVRSLTRQLEGEFDLQNAFPGTRARMVFDLKATEGPSRGTR